MHYRGARGKTFDLKPKWWSVLSVIIHTHTHSFTHIQILLNHAKEAIWSASNPGEVTSYPTGFTRSPLSSTKGQNNNIMVSTECLPPSKNISVRVGLTYLFSRIKNTKPSVFRQLLPGCPVENRRRALKILTFWNNKTQSSNTLLRQTADPQIQVSAWDNSY